jgi:hypothetical protein
MLRQVGGVSSSGIEIQYEPRETLRRIAPAEPGRRCRRGSQRDAVSE